MSRETDVVLALVAESLDDIEKARIAAENRHRSLIQVYGMEGTPQEQAAGMFTAGLADLEQQTTLRLRRAMKAHPLGPWVKAQKGIGDKQAARLLAAIGDPYWHPETRNEDDTVRHAEGPRTVSQLWAYAGLHVLPVSHAFRDAQQGAAGGNQTSNPDRPDGGTLAPIVGVAAKRRKGQKANWSATAKMRAYLIATSCMKQPDGNQFRDLYVNRRAHTTVTHPEWTPIHSHNDGLRIVAKAVLKELWIEARRLREGDIELESAA